MKKYLVVVLLLSLFGCASGTYIAPKQDIPKDPFYKILDKSFDETWKELIQYTGSTFYAIDSHEKASGLITLSFSSSNPSLYIDGGEMDVSSLIINFKGSYADYLAKYFNAALEGKMNIVVTELQSQKTKIQINVRYIFATHTSQIPNSTWIFDSGTCDTKTVLGKTVGTSDERTFCPTYKVEKDILDAIK